MTHEHWNTLFKIINGEIQTEKPIGFIIDNPWLPQWYGVSIIVAFHDKIPKINRQNTNK